MNDEILKTKISGNSADFIERRKMLIAEAIALPSGTRDAPRKTIVSDMGGGAVAYFSKPGKEAARAKPNPYDMLPGIEIGGRDVTRNWAFQQLWEYLIKISTIRRDAFDKILVLLYRLCYFSDHREVGGKFRYAPSGELLGLINNLQAFVLDGGFAEKFGGKEIDLLHFLYFVDLLGWNEDVKYNTEDGRPQFGPAKNKGRVNTILSIISAPLMIGEFMRNIADNAARPSVRIDVRLVTQAIQKFTKSRGLCVLPGRELKQKLAPYLE
jgi:hypothetical protein